MTIFAGFSLLALAALAVQGGVFILVAADATAAHLLVGPDIVLRELLPEEDVHGQAEHAEPDQHEYNGIFASVVGGVIKNLTVDVDGFAATSAFGGAAIAGVAKNCFLTNLVATGTIIGQSSTPCTHSAAGIAVRMEGTVAYACTNRCEIWSGKGKLGGIAAMGQGDRADSLILCSNEGDIHGTKTGGLGDGGVGGIFGYQGYGDGYQAVTYTNCRNIGQVTSLSSDKTGSILGHHSNSGPTFVGTTVTRDDMVVSGYGQDGVTYGKSIGGGLVELCTAVER